MDFAKAADIAALHKPALLVDEQNPAVPAAFVVRRKPGGAPFSIHIPTDHAQDEETEAREEQAFRAALDAADQHLPEEK